MGIILMPKKKPSSQKFVEIIQVYSEWTVQKFHLQNQNCKIFGIKMQKTPVTSNIPMGSLNQEQKGMFIT